MKINGEKNKEILLVHKGTNKKCENRSLGRKTRRSVR